MKKKISTFWLGVPFLLLLLLVFRNAYNDYQYSARETQPYETENTAVSVIIPFTATPAFLARPDCPSENMGRVIFTRKQSGTNILFIMEGNGCNVRELLIDVSDSPAWSPNADKIAVGCEDSTAICILNTINLPIVIKRIQPPEKCVRNWIKSISWLSSGNELIVVCGKLSEFDNVYRIAINSDNEHQTILSAEEVLRAVASPLDDQIVVSIPPYIYLIDINGSIKKRLVKGTSPEWAPDGTKIVFLKEDEKRGIAMINSDGTGFEWVYMPEKPIGLGCSEVRSDCRLSWSPNGQYLVFNGLYAPYTEPGINYQIFRLNLFTKEVEIISNDTASRFYSEPDWGP